MFSIRRAHQRGKTICPHSRRGAFSGCGALRRDRLAVRGRADKNRIENRLCGTAVRISILEVAYVKLMKPNHRFERWIHRGTRPNRVARALTSPWAKPSASGGLPTKMVTLRVPGRHTRKSTSVPLVVANHEGERYLVSMLGQRATWVHDVRTANGDVTLHHSRSEHVHLVEVDAAERAPILRQYLEVAPDARAHIPVHRKAPLEDFAAIAATFPVFRITSTGPSDGS